MTILTRLAASPASKACLIGLTVGAMTLTAACTSTSRIWREEGAVRIATSADMMKRQIDAGTMRLVTFERVHDKGGVANVYIEGDGLALDGKHKILPTLDPTPDNPVALDMAARDRSPNVIYLARPCQYITGPASHEGCTREGWEAKRFSMDNMTAMNAAMDDIKKFHGFTGFNLIGYDGGGQVAALLAAKRKDVLSIRTVASALDHKAWAAHRALPAFDGSLNAADFAHDIAGIPQHHFIGAWDETVTGQDYMAYRNAMGPSNCVRLSVIDETDHDKGWANRWPSMLDMPVDCASDQ